MTRSRAFIVDLRTAVTVYAKPRAVKDDEGPNCGLKKAVKATGCPTKAPFIKSDPKATFVCEICLDLVLIVEMYAECEESYVHDQMGKDCDCKFPNQPLQQQVCHSFINDLYNELLNDTEQSPEEACTKLINHECHYNRH